ncbi:MAG: YafY family protein [Gammaproteobacteria bacterium]
MDKFDRIFALHKILSSRKTPVSLQDIGVKLECSRATVNRIIRNLRDQLGAPVEYDRERNGYYYDRQQQPLFELPGLWLNTSELFALMVSQKLLTDLQPGLLQEHLKPLRDRITAILHHQHAGHPQIDQRVRILQHAARGTDLEAFRKVATALLDRRRIRILYRSRGSDELTERVVSPQRLIYYRDNWYLDSWCHLRKDLRSFSLDRMSPRDLLDKPAREISETELNNYYAAAYGIFSGTADQTAVLRFNADAARWVADEQWHPDQQGKILTDGCYELRIPYGNPTELIMDILKYGPDVEVLAPLELRSLIRQRLQETMGIYREQDIPS